MEGGQGAGARGRTAQAPLSSSRSQGRGWEAGPASRPARSRPGGEGGWGLASRAVAALGAPQPDRPTLRPRARGVRAALSGACSRGDSGGAVTQAGGGARADPRRPTLRPPGAREGPGPACGLSLHANVLRFTTRCTAAFSMLHIRRRMLAGELPRSAGRGDSK